MAPRGLRCPPAGPTPPAQHCLPRSYQPHCPALPHTDAEKALGAIRALPAVTFAELRVFFVQAFWLRHSLVAVLFHLPASNISFPHTHSLWTPPGASAFRVNTGGKCYETLMWQTTPPPSPTEGKRHAAHSKVRTLASAGAKAGLPCNLNTLPGMWKCPGSFSWVLFCFTLSTLAYRCISFRG